MTEQIYQQDTQSADYQGEPDHKGNVIEYPESLIFNAAPPQVIGLFLVTLCSTYGASR